MLSVLLCGAMIGSLLTGCGSDSETSSTDTATTDTTVSADIPQDYKYYYSFDEADDSDAIAPTERVSSSLNIIEKDKNYIPGVKGESIYVDGITGYTLTDVNGVGDSYTVAYWTYCKRSALYMANTIWGPDIYGDKAIGGELWAAFDWLASDDGTTNNFPSVWSNDALGAGRASWTIAENDDGVGKWMHVAMVIDANDITADGLCNIAKIYIDGKEYTKSSNGEVVETKVVKGAMNPSDSFEFCLGINYWDSVFKGAIDELYIYDYALDADQIAALYADGDGSVAFEEPERVITVTADETAIESVGSMDYSNAYGDSYSSLYEVKDGQTLQLKMKSWSDGKDTSDNYSLVFMNGDDELASVCADMTGFYAGDTTKIIEDSAFTWSWGNWNTWKSQVMVESDATVLITKNGSEITLEFDNVDYNETSNPSTAVITLDDVAEGSVFFKVTNKACYTDILGTKDKTVTTGGIVVGNTDCTTAWWSQFSDIFEVAEGQSVSKTFTNYTDGVNNWDNFVVILQNTPTGHSADTEGYAEYAVVRADNFGWGTGYDAGCETDCNWNWDTFITDMDGAKVTVTITNNGSTADIYAYVVTTTGTEYYQSYKNIAIDGPLYACFSCEASYLDFSAYTVGNTDCSTAWWSQFGNINYVPEGESKTVYFKNYTDGANNWDNFICILQNIPDAHSVDADANYAEYAVVRADNFGWGTGYETATLDCDWNWDTFTTDIDGAYVALTVTNNGDTADISAVITTTEGTQYHQSYTGITTGGDLYFTLSCEASYLLIEAE